MLNSLCEQLPKDSILMFHSSLKSLGVPVDMDCFISDLINAAGKHSTLVMPTFNFNFDKDKVFNPDTTPSHNGVITECFRKYIGVKRTLNPMQSLAIYGEKQKKYLASPSETTFGKNSIFEYMYEDDAYIVLIGVDYNKVTFYHYLEEKYNVPYRFWKTFSGEVQNKGESIEINYQMFVRELEYMPNINHYGLLLEERGLVNKFSFHQSIIRIFKMRDMYDLLKEDLINNPYCMVNTNKDLWEIKTKNEN